MSPQPQTQRQHSGKTLLSFHRFPCGTPPSLTEGAGRITQAPRRMSSPPGPSARPAALLLPPSLLHLSAGTPSSTRLTPEAGRLPRFDSQPLPLPLQPRSGTRLTVTTAPAGPHKFWVSSITLGLARLSMSPHRHVEPTKMLIRYRRSGKGRQN